MGIDLRMKLLIKIILKPGNSSFLRKLRPRLEKLQKFFQISHNQIDLQNLFSLFGNFSTTTTAATNPLNYLLQKSKIYDLLTMEISENRIIAHLLLLLPRQHRNDIQMSTQPIQRRRKHVLVLVSKTSQIGLKWKSRRPIFKTPSRRRPKNIFLETSSRLVPGHVLKTFFRRCPQGLFQETSLRRKSKGPHGDYLWVFHLCMF